MLFVMISLPAPVGKHKRRTCDVARKALQDSDILVHRSIMVSPECYSSHQSDRINTFCSGNRDFFYYPLLTFQPPNTYIIKDLIELRIISVYIPKGSIPLNKSIAKEVGNEKIVQTRLRSDLTDVGTHYSPISQGYYVIWCCIRLLVVMLPSPPLHRSQTTSRLRSGQHKLTPGREILKYNTVHHIYRSGP
jgi:hypothetical protein